MKHRKQALIWWNNLSPIEQEKYFSVYSVVHFTPSVSPSTLTGREIEQIWLIYAVEAPLAPAPLLLVGAVSVFVFALYILYYFIIKN